MKVSTFLQTVFLFFAAAVIATVMLVISGAIVDSLPRSHPGGSVLVPYWLCVFSSVGFAWFIPSLAAGFFLRSTKIRTCFFLGLALIVLAVYFGGGFGQSLYKAYFWGGG